MKEKKRKEKKRKEKTAPFGVNSLKSPVLYQAAQGMLNAQASGGCAHLIEDQQGRHILACVVSCCLYALTQVLH